MALPLGSPHWVSSGRQLSLHGSKVFGATVGVSQPWEGGARLPNPLPPRSTKPLTCPVSPPTPPRAWERVSARPGTKPSCCLFRVAEPPGVAGRARRRRWPLGPAPCSRPLASPRAGARPASGNTGGARRRGDLGAALGYHLRHGGPSASWDNRAVIPEGPLRRGCPEHLCQVWLPRGRGAPSPPVPGAVETGPTPHVCPRVGTRLVRGDP